MLPWMRLKRWILAPAGNVYVYQLLPVTGRPGRPRAQDAPRQMKGKRRNEAMTDIVDCFSVNLFQDEDGDCLVNLVEMPGFLGLCRYVSQSVGGVGRS